MLVKKSDSAIMCPSLSAENGTYKLVSNRKGPAELNISHISYKTQTINIPAMCDSVMIISLEDKSYSVGDVTVSGKRKTISVNESGNMVVVRENLKSYELQTVSEIMKKIPGLTVTADGISTDTVIIFQALNREISQPVPFSAA